MLLGFILHCFSLKSPSYKLVWHDEFNRPGAPNPADWTYEHGFVRNQELQWYQPQNATVTHGHLLILGKRETVPNTNYEAGSPDWHVNRPQADYTSASVTTQGLHSWLYGRFVVRAKFDPSLGMWPAIWFLGTERTWPHCGEIDLMEYYHHTLLANFCWGNNVWNSVKTPLATLMAKDPNWTKKFHTWVMDWTANSVTLSVDHQLLNTEDITKTVEPDGFNPFHHPLYLILNLAIGATGGDPSATKFPAKFEVDYVRVYQKQ